MIRTIEGFHRDEQGYWVAELACLHNQHVRHRPPFHNRPWVTSATGRAARVGGELDCPLCDRAELPVGLVLVRTAGPFEAATLPAALRRTHRVADRTWGVLRVLEGSVGLTMETSPPVDILLQAGDQQPLPPGVPHRVLVGGPLQMVVDFLRRPS